jgi:hypothetical protein
LTSSDGETNGKLFEILFTNYNYILEKRGESIAQGLILIKRSYGLLKYQNRKF